jgi:hypothetical protein
VDIVLGGHTHLYQRGCRNRLVVEKRGEKREPQTVCFLSVGGGGGQLELEEERVEDWKLFEVTAFAHHYVEMEVEDALLTFVVRDMNGGVLDRLQIERSL